eukprot:c24645_g1_i1 orf=805-3201(+)
MYAVGMLGSYLTQGVYAVAGPFQPFGGAVDIIVVQQEDGTFKSSPWYVKFGDFQGVLKSREKIVDIAVNDIPADFHMFLDNKGEAYFEKEVEPDEGMCLALPDASSSPGDNRAEGETESLISTQTSVGASSHAQESVSPETSLTSHRSNGIVDEKPCTEVKSATEEESSEDETESLVSTQTVVDASLHAQEAVSPKTSFTLHGSNGIMDEKSCAEVKSGREEKALDMQELASVVCGLEAVHTQNEDIDMDVRTANSLTVADTLELKDASAASLDLTRSDGSGTVVKDDCMFHNSAVFTWEEGSCLQAAVKDLSTDSKAGVEGDQLVVDLWTEGDILEGIQGNGKYEDGSNYGVSLDDEEMFASFECLTVEGEKEAHIYANNCISDEVPDDLETEQVNRDSTDWDSESPVNQGSSDDDLAVSQNSTSLLEEKSGDVDLANTPSEKNVCEMDVGNESNDVGSPGNLAAVSPPSRWSLWPLWFRRSRIEKGPLSASLDSNQALLAAANVAIESPFTEELLKKNGYYKWQPKTKVRTYVPTSAQLALLNLKDGPNKVTFTFSRVLGKTQVDARIYLWKWDTRIVISDVDGTITKSDVLGQVMPLVGRDWSQYGVTRLFSAIKDNGFEVLFLSARAISQAYLTRRFLLNLKQDGEALPEGPVFISPDGLIPSLYREVIRRAPHEFKIACLEGIRELFPKDVNPFYAGFGNRETDEISYLKVGIPKGKIFIINPKGEVVVNHRVDCKSYTSLHALVDEMFSPLSMHEQEDFNEWNFWKMPIPDIEDELTPKSSKNAKRANSLKK